jgi:hypothetical protein
LLFTRSALVARNALVAFSALVALRALVARSAVVAFFALVTRRAGTILPEETGPVAFTEFFVAGLADFVFVSDFFVTAIVVSSFSI